MKRILHCATTALGLLGIIALAGVANATPLDVTNASVTIWNYVNSPGLITDPCEQALPTNPCAVLGNQVYTGLYTGAIDFTNPATNDIVTFLNTAGGSFSPSIGGLTETLSSGGFATSSLFNFVLTIGVESLGTISHDDGISIYDSTNTVVFIDSSFPTAVIDTPFDLLPGTYHLWYAEVNGLPAKLVMDVTSTKQEVPEPASLALLGAGLAGLALTRRRRKSA